MADKEENLSDIERILLDEKIIAGSFNPEHIEVNYNAHFLHAQCTMLHESAHEAIMRETQFGHLCLLLGRFILQSRTMNDVKKQERHSLNLKKALSMCRRTLELQATVFAYQASVELYGQETANKYIQTRHEDYQKLFRDFLTFVRDTNLTSSVCAGLFTQCTRIAMNVPSLEQAIVTMRAPIDFASCLKGVFDINDRFRICCVELLRHIKSCSPNTDIKSWLELEPPVPSSAPSKESFDKMLATVQSQSWCGAVEKAAIRDLAEISQSSLEGEPLLDSLFTATPQLLPRKTAKKVRAPLRDSLVKQAEALVCGTTPYESPSFFIIAARSDWDENYMGHYNEVQLAGCLNIVEEQAVLVYRNDFDFKELRIKGCSTLPSEGLYVLLQGSSISVKNDLRCLLYECGLKFDVGVFPIKSPEVMVYILQYSGSPTIRFVFLGSQPSIIWWAKEFGRLKEEGRMGDITQDSESQAKMEHQLKSMFLGL